VGTGVIWHLLLRAFFNQHKILMTPAFLPFQKWEIAKKNFLRQHAFMARVLCFTGGSPDRESDQQ